MNPREELEVLVHRKVTVEAESLGEIADVLLDPCKVPGQVVTKDPRASCPRRQYAAWMMATLKERKII